MNNCFTDVSAFASIKSLTKKNIKWIPHNFKLQNWQKEGCKQSKYATCSFVPIRNYNTFGRTIGEEKFIVGKLRRTHHGWSFVRSSLAGKQGWRVTLEWRSRQLGPRPGHTGYTEHARDTRAGTEKGLRHGRRSETRPGRGSEAAPTDGVQPT